MPTFTMQTTSKTETETDAPLSMSMSTRVMSREQNRNARLKALRDGTFEEVNMDDDTIVEALVEALVAGPSPAGTIEPVAGEALWVSDAVCEKPYVDAAIVISDDEDDEDDEESEVAKVAEVAEVAKAEVGQAPRLPFSCPFMLLPTHDSDLTCPESPVSPASPAAPEAPEAVEAGEEDYIDTVARRRAANDALRAGFAKAFAAIAAIEKEEDQRATPAPIAAEVLALVSAPHARQPPGTQVTAADTEMVAEATEEGPDSYAPDPQALPLPHANGTMPKARSALRSLGTWSPAGPSPAIRKSRRSKK